MWTAHLVHSTSSQGKAGEPSAHSRAFSHAVGTVLGGGSTSSSSAQQQQQPIAIPPVAQLLPREQVSGSTDGLILLRLARASALQVPPHESLRQLDAMMESMYHYIAALPDEQVARGVEPLPGVLETLRHLAALRDCAEEEDRGADAGRDDDPTAATATATDGVLCGLVTGNVEGVARRKMRATGILQTGALAPAAPEQRVWVGSEHLGFLGGFGSDFCSGAVDDPARNHLDRAEQIGIAVRRCRALLQVASSSSGNPKKKNRVLTRVVHVGDAPSDVLAAKAYAEQQHAANSGVVVGMVATATGRYTASELREHAGESVPGKWECVVLEDGMADPLAFLKACGVAIHQQ